jgi:hypothetical protein
MVLVDELIGFRLGTNAEETTKIPYHKFKNLIPSP